ncbi:MAG: tRNA (adenosine(37)-N6)-threonylcarbamoyltransferase complex ATPase subunit type 1 TsaE [Flavobacteriaceae bacterium]|nr:tRNA (adenosine(37)-N6)-threonylcarbamoyltransferase complex ATPase subunit type 1 TsaE [Flavobacteriaceae bacterium]
MELTYNIQDLEEVAATILEHSTCKTFMFYGAMGVGKTTLIKKMAAHLGVEESLSSPTFSIVNEHTTERGILYHFDFYRIEKEEEALDIGIEDYFESDAWIFVEWPNKIENFLPEQYCRIEIEINNDQSRTLKLTPVK